MWDPKTLYKPKAWTSLGPDRTCHCFAEGGGQSISDPAAGNHGEGRALEVLNAEVPSDESMHVDYVATALRWSSTLDRTFEPGFHNHWIPDWKNDPQAARGKDDWEPSCTSGWIVHILSSTPSLVCSFTGCTCGTCLFYPSIHPLVDVCHCMPRSAKLLVRIPLPPLDQRHPETRHPPWLAKSETNRSEQSQLQEVSGCRWEDVKIRTTTFPRNNVEISHKKLANSICWRS